MMQRECPECAQLFRPNFPRQRFCSQTCSNRRTNRERAIPLVERFWAGLQQGDGCWEWQRARSDGYGVLGDQLNGRRRVYVHRLSWEIHYGPIPDGLCVLHHCDNPCCARPDHLFLGTKADNWQDCIEKGRRRQGYVGIGEANHASKLTEVQVREVLREHAAGTLKKSAKARELGVTPRVILLITRREVWRHVEAPAVAWQQLGLEEAGA